ncbi:uncharacterized protein N7511_006060 [Penicillium nucicola]|uniref:uncharacterized protein n=1 Tax=Penicillium nucicola TaxID=1850975 RepID=UPI0025459D1C|nr:uncharacterized protein N7511_006060 [Penicillium nucicola]KAJ5757366.1 hypothetical protein N7511_006060 [Penicillium nucicola]
MEPFQYSLSDDRIVAGVHSIPPSSSLLHRPLIIAMHGGCYDHKYFDATPTLSASVPSAAFGVPFVSIDRPSYGGTSSVLPIPADSDFPEQTALFLHQQILPELWRKIGLPNRCNCIILLCHSLGVMPGIITAALHAKDDVPIYPLGGIIASGMGDKQSSFMKGNPPSFLPVDEDYARFPLDAKNKVMFKPGTFKPEILEHTERLDAACPLSEAARFATDWLPIWKQKWAAQVSVPVMFSLVEDDPFFVATEEEVEACTKAFTGSVRVDGSLIRGAPHCVELSHWSQGWYARCFGFAMECSASLSFI